MLEHLRARWTKVMSPLADLLLKANLTPDVVTWVGTVGTVAIALVFFPLGWLWPGCLLLLLFIFSDSLDGIMARKSGRGSPWGAFLDSTLDRIADGAIFGGLALYFAGPGHSVLWCGVGIMTLVFGQVTSYTKARGESLGFTVNGGLAGRADRLLVGLLGALLTGVGVSWALPAGLGVLLVAGVITVGQRMVIVARQARPATQQTATQPATDQPSFEKPAPDESVFIKPADSSDDKPAGPDQSSAV